MENFYERLGISESATEREIKKAYNYLLRKYPPENNPEQFKRIREAYEVLSDKNKKIEYDAYLIYGDKIKILMEKAEKTYDEGKIEEAIYNYKEILKLVPNWVEIKNHIGILSIKAEKYKAAINIYTELLEEMPNEDIYYRNRGMAYLNSRQVELAEDDYKKAYEISEELEDIATIAWIYWKTKDQDKAILYLKRFIKKQRNKGGLGILYVVLIEFYVVNKNRDLFEKTLEELGEIISKNKSNYKIESQRLEELAIDLEEDGFQVESLKVLEKAMEFDKENSNLKERYKSIKNKNIRIKEYEKLIEDEAILKVTKGVIYYALFKEQQRDEINNNIEAIRSYIYGNQYKSVIDSIEQIKRNYNELYLIRSNIYELILEEARNHEELMIQVDYIKSSTVIIEPIKNLIDLWVRDDIEKEERDRIFDRILEEINKSNSEKIIKSIEFIKENYKKVYNLNSKYLEYLTNWAKERHGFIPSDDKVIVQEQKNEERKVNNNSEVASESELGCLGEIFVGALMIGGIFFIGSILISLLPYIIGIGVLVILVKAFSS